MKLTVTTKTMGITFDCDTFKYSIGAYYWTIATFDSDGNQLEVITIGKGNGSKPEFTIED